MIGTGTVRNHVVGVAAALSVIALALVFAAAGRLVPPTAFPRAPDVVLHAIPHVNAAISVLAIVTIASGWRAIRHHEVARHRRAMLVGFGLFGTFLALYFYKVVVAGPATFAGPDLLYRYVYLPILGVHMLLATVCVPLLVYVLLLGLTHTVEELPETRHPKAGRVTVVLWLASFGLGVVVWALLYVIPF